MAKQLPPLLAALLALAAGACSSSSTGGATCDTVCKNVGDCGGTSCLAMCITAQTSCNEAEQPAVFQSWAACGPVFNCVNNAYVPAATCAPQQDALLACAAGVPTHDAGIAITFPDGGSSRDGNVVTAKDGASDAGHVGTDAGIDATTSPCGACAGACVNDVCIVTLAAGLEEPEQIAIDDANVYWTEVSGGTVSAVPKAGGPASALVSGEDEPYGIAVDATNVYWTTAADEGGVMKIGKGGAGLATLASGQNEPAGIVVSGTTVYWANSAFGEAGDVVDVGVSGGTPFTIAPGLSPVSLAVGSSALYWVTEGSGPASGTVMRDPLDGSAVVTLVSGLDGPSAVAVDSTNVYWVTEDGAAMKTPLTGGAVTTLASGQDDPLVIATDGVNVYWTNNGDGSVVKVGVNGGATTTIATGSGNMGGIAVDATSVYWAAYTAGTLMKATPK